jgi:hypothetical protein
MRNTTLINITTQLNNALATSIPKPYIQYDLTTGLFTLYVGQAATANNRFTVYGEPGSFFWIVYGKRQSINVEPDINDIKINKWLTKEWGEIPADFGRK